MYYLKLISLKDCPYSEAASSLLKDNKIKSEIIVINRSEKDKFKTDEIKTFPQVYLKKQKSSGSVLIGGYDEIKSYYDIIHSTTKRDKILSKLKSEIKSNNKEISDKSILRLIELLI